MTSFVEFVPSYICLNYNAKKSGKPVWCSNKLTQREIFHAFIFVYLNVLDLMKMKIQLLKISEYYSKEECSKGI